MIKQDESFDKSMNGFIPKAKGEVDLIGKLFMRRVPGNEKFGHGTLVCGVLFGLDWGKQQLDEMWEVEVNIKPVRRFIAQKKKDTVNMSGWRIDQVMCGDWDNRKNYRKIKDF